MAVGAAGRPEVRHGEGWARERAALRADRTFYTSPVAKDVPSVATPEHEDAPPLDPDAVTRAYRFHRARRAARERRLREKRWAGVRFWLVLAVVVSVTVFLALRTLGELERVFGL
jgi:hypothetical protein